MDDEKLEISRSNFFSITLKIVTVVLLFVLTVLCLKVKISIILNRIALFCNGGFILYI